MRDKPDHYSLQAQREGYPARSVYKLKEIDEKFRIIKKGSNIIDIGASPGSWTLYVCRKLKGTGNITAVDLKALGLGINCQNLNFFKDDAFSEKFQETAVKTGPYDSVISDAAPSTTGNRTVDTGRSYNLAEDVLNFALKNLKGQGSLVIKIFQGGDEHQLLDIMKDSFKVAKIFKPKASRKESFEVFLVGTGKL
ncbi:MAG: RlmE family RNA methyltransferase [Spirochaetia bacterium]|jgi:23S rRNA (uridine2552-2'-O)-methyltransferase|nr:RlmE family RNA methyltransferase [Spirochaetia bacterium]